MDRPRRITCWILFGAAGIPPLAIALLVARHARNVPWKDQWGVIPFIVAVERGEVRPAMLWSQVNEHRIPVALALHGLLGWWTRWDVRYEAWLDVVLAALTMLALAGLAWRTIGERAPMAGAIVTLGCSIVTFSLTGGINWTWGAMLPAYLAALAATMLAWQLAAWTGTWPRTIVLAACATAGALSFGAGVVLVVLLPVALVLMRSVPLRRRLAHAIAATTWAVALIAVYFVGWRPRVGEPQPVMHWDRLADYARYAVTYVGAGITTFDLGEGLVTGIVLCAVLTLSSAWLWRRRELRAAVVPWWLLAAYSAVNAAITAFGRLDNGLFTALFVRYLPTASLFLVATMALAALATATLWHASQRAATVAVSLLAFGLATATPLYVRTARKATENMGVLALQLEAGAACLPTCATAADDCLLLMCWSADVARQMCPLMAAAKIGPFAP
ncbi:MAG TPA: hypothetical protein VMS22_03500 [Candidatus Eisenbacteria bacterium]|nr:hypothetical protein [Candidatus Eisenbacteria bacterium]